MIATVGFTSPFQVATRQLTLKAKDRKPPVLGPEVRVAAAHLHPEAEETQLQALINGSGLSDRRKDGFLEHSIDPAAMWRGALAPGLSIEFELAETAALGAIQVWNYNLPWQTADGIRKADIAVSADGNTWRTVVSGAEFPEADGTEDYDQPALFKLNGVTARKVRFENIVTWENTGKVGLSEVVFYSAAGQRAAVEKPIPASDAPRQ